MTVAVFDNGAHIVSHLIQHFGTHNKPKYHIKEITVNKLEKESLLRQKSIKTTEVSVFLHVGSSN